MIPTSTWAAPFMCFYVVCRDQRQAPCLIDRTRHWLKRWMRCLEGTNERDDKPSQRMERLTLSPNPSPLKGEGS